MPPMERDLLTMEMVDAIRQGERALRLASPQTANQAVNGYKDVIIIGSPDEPLYRFDDSSIETLSTISGVDVVGSELSVDQLTPTVLYISRTVLQLWAPKGYQGLLGSDGRLFVHRVPKLDLRKLPYGTPVWYFRNEALVGKYYSLNVDRVAKVFYQINAVSPVGLLDKTQHRGNIYTGQTFEEVVGDIIGGVVPYRCSPDVQKLRIYNWLPIASRRSNLHQLLFAYGVAVLRDDQGDMYFDYLGSSAVKEIPDGRIYYGGSVDYSTPATGVEVTEHSYSALPSVEPVTLFDNTETAVGADHTFVPFDQAPVFGLEATGNLQIIDSGVNWAIVTGVGVLTGKPYTHTSKVITLTSSNAQDHEPNVVRVTDATLVNLTNSHNVAQRVLEYYSSAKRITTDISLEGESAGDRVSLSDPFGDPSQGFLERLEINVSSNLKANCTIVTDYNPNPERPNFTQVEVLTGEGDYVVPEGVHLIRAAMIQGGTGGGKAYNGQPAQATKVDTWTDVVTAPGPGHYAARWAKEGGEGGDPGPRGEPGKVFVVDIPVTPGQVIHYKSGAIGKGAPADAAPGTPGQEGGESTFGEYSSASGYRPVYGWVDDLTGTVYAKPGRQGIKGGKGSGEKTTKWTDPHWGPEHKTEYIPGDTLVVDGVSYAPGTSRTDRRVDTETVGTATKDYGSFTGGRFGSSGGGAAYGRNGGSGVVPTSSGVTFVYKWSDSSPSYRVYYFAHVNAIEGGSGANALSFPASTGIGEGGAAGNGGGGAGAQGTAWVENRVGKGATSGELTVNVGTLGSVGLGSAGSDGGPGGILVYSAPPAEAQNNTAEEAAQ